MAWGRRADVGLNHPMSKMSFSSRLTGHAKPLAKGPRMATTTKKDLIDRIADTTQQRRSDVKRTVQAFLDQVIDELGRGNRLEFRDFGVFEIKERAPRVAQNPKTLERVQVPARRTVKFKVGRLMRETLEQQEEITISLSDPVETPVGTG